MEFALAVPLPWYFSWHALTYRVVKRLANVMDIHGTPMALPRSTMIFRGSP